jgi:LacI family transcriptional regulator
MSVRMGDVARHAGVSLGTVSNVLNGRPSVSDSLRERVLASIEELGFVRNESARQLRAGSSRTIAFVVFDASNPFFSEVSKGAEGVVRDAGRFLLIADTHEDRDRETAYLRLFQEQRVQGVLVAPMSDVSALLGQLYAQGIPSVIVDTRSPTSEYSAVRVDNFMGGKIAVTHLLEVGKRRIGFLGGPADIWQISERLAGAREALRVTGLDPAGLRVWHVRSSDVVSGELIADAFASLPAAKRPDGIFATNDLLAMGLMHGLLRRGEVRIPDDLSIVGYDDIPWAHSAAVPLSSVRQPSVQMGATAAQFLLDVIEKRRVGQRERVFVPELVVRASSAPGYPLINRHIATGGQPPAVPHVNRPAGRESRDSGADRSSRIGI